MVLEILKERDGSYPYKVRRETIHSIVIVKKISQRRANITLVDLVEILYGPKLAMKQWDALDEDLYEGREAIKQIFSYENK